MKKIYTMVAAALAVGVSANAQDLTPTEVELKNPSFEEIGTTYPDGMGNLEGWEIAGGNATTTDDAGNTVSTNLYAFQNRNKSWTDGNYGMRSAADVNIDGGNYIMQTVMGQKPGTYVLQFDGEITRNGWKGGWGEGMKGFAFIVDNYGDPETEGTAEEPAEGSTFFYVGDQSKGDTWQILYRYYVVHTTEAATFDDGETDIKFGFGYPTSSASISKARFCFDNFHLYYFDTDNTDDVKKYVDETLIGAIKSVNDSGETLYKVVNPTGSIEQTLAGVVGNTPATLGISDVTVAPATVEGNNKYYNLQGIEVADPTQPGLYIHNGKKILVK